MNYADRNMPRSLCALAGDWSGAITTLESLALSFGRWILVLFFLFVSSGFSLLLPFTLQSLYFVQDRA